MHIYIYIREYNVELEAPTIKLNYVVIKKVKDDKI